MQCNIDAKGRATRLISGLVLLIVGVLLLALAITGFRSSTWVYASALALIAVGAFQIFEGWKGWCVVRAMGFKTRI